ncbi:MAG: tRNA (guanine-N7-)-methyltransferase [Frankiaceae bacterium]|jgi:tRNA (guanine-N7-)-methyltransferase|nr:tRNA (guanine-N7-)-methyltransferase [Frankiaceae bacterium]
MTQRTAPHTFKLRRGRLTAHQAEGLERLGPVYGVPVTDKPLVLSELFGRAAPLVVEVGFGMGEATVAMALADPARDVLAVDVHSPGVGKLLRALESAQLSNVRVVEADALHVLRTMLDGVLLDEVRVYFPDPWPKARHAKRRLVSSSFCDLVAARLRPGGVLHVATDWEPYARLARGVLQAHPDFEVAVLDTRPAHRPLTRFEQRGHAAGRRSFDLLATRG